MRMCLAITVACVTLCAISLPALGGTFEVVACGDAPGGTNNSWAATTNQPAYLAVTVACPPSAEYSGIAVKDSLAAPGGAPTGSIATWQFAAPKGTVVTGLRYSRFMGKDGDNDWQVFARTGDGEVLDTCEIPETQIRCSVGQSGYSPGTERVVTGLSADSVRFGVGCTPTGGATTCSIGVQLHRVWATLYSATVTLEDAVAPLVTQTGGPLLGLEYAAGTQVATFSATDNTGIRAGRIYIDGALAASAAYDCDFTYAVPCANRSDAHVSLDTSPLTDGPHSVQVAAVDPAGNETRSSSQEIVVDNHAPAAPDGLSVDGGPDWRDSNSFDVSWTNPGDSGSPVSVAHYAVCAVDGSGCFSEQQTSGADISHLSGLTVPSPGAWALRVWLEDAAGNAESAHAAETTLRFGSDPTTTTAPLTTAPTKPASSADTSPPLAEPLAAPSLDAPTTATPPQTTDRTNPRLRLTSARLSRARLVLRGRSASKLPLSLTIRLPNGHVLRRHATVRGGQFTLVFRSRQLTRNSIVTASFAGSPTLTPARATLRVRG